MPCNGVNTEVLAKGIFFFEGPAIKERPLPQYHFYQETLLVCPCIGKISVSGLRKNKIFSFARFAPRFCWTSKKKYTLCKGDFCITPLHG